MSVDFTYKSVDIWLLLSSKTVTSRKEMLESENSWVNFMVLCDELMCVMNSLSFSSPWVQTIKMSSMYLHQMNGLSGDRASSFLSRSPINKFA